MTDTITLPRSVVEQALEALDEADLLMEHRQNIELRRSALVALRAALEQPDIEIPASVPEGWKLVPVEPTDDMLYDIQEYSHILPPRGRRIWAHMLAAAPQPPALEQPQECYDQRDPLADQQIDAIAESMPGGLDGFLKGWGWRQFARAVLEAAPQPPTTEQSSAVVEECLTDELKPRFSAHDDAERLKSVARGMSYNDHGEAIWKHTLMEIAVRLESGGYAAPQPPALEQPQVKQGPIWYHKHWAEDNDIFYRPTEAVPDGAVPLYLHPQNLNCKSNQARLATLWGYVKEQPPRRPLTDQQINDHRLALAYDSEDLPDPWDFKQGVRAAERAHGITGETK